jgi:hypothetical protein
MSDSVNIEPIEAARLAEIDKLRTVIEQTQYDVQRYHRQGGPRRLEKAAKLREHIRCWEHRINEIEGELLRLPFPSPVKRDSRITFGILYFATEHEAQVAAIHTRGGAYNGGYRHGSRTGRDMDFDHVDPEHGQVYAVTVP